jgi:hypothetical protein
MNAQENLAPSSIERCVITLLGIIIPLAPPAVLIPLAILQFEVFTCDQALSGFVVITGVLYIIGYLFWKKEAFGVLEERINLTCTKACLWLWPVVAEFISGTIVWVRVYAYEMPTPECAKVHAASCFPCKYYYYNGGAQAMIQIFIAAYFLHVAFPMLCILVSLCGAYTRCVSTGTPLGGTGDMRCHQQAASFFCWWRGFSNSFRWCGCICPDPNTSHVTERGAVSVEVRLPIAQELHPLPAVELQGRVLDYQQIPSAPELASNYIVVEGSS